MSVSNFVWRKKDYCVILACTQIISSYYKHKEIIKDAFLVSDHDKEILMNNEEFMQIMKKYGINFEWIRNDFYKFWLIKMNCYLYN